MDISFWMSDANGFDEEEVNGGILSESGILRMQNIKQVVQNANDHLLDPSQYATGPCVPNVDPALTASVAAQVPAQPQSRVFAANLDYLNRQQQRSLRNIDSFTEGSNGHGGPRFSVAPKTVPSSTTDAQSSWDEASFLQRSLSGARDQTPDTSCFTPSVQSIPWLPARTHSLNRAYTDDDIDLDDIDDDVFGIPPGRTDGLFGDTHSNFQAASMTDALTADDDFAWVTAPKPSTMTAPLPIVNGTRQQFPSADAFGTLLAIAAQSHTQEYPAPPGIGDTVNLCFDDTELVPETWAQQQLAFSSSHAAHKFPFGPSSYRPNIHPPSSPPPPPSLPLPPPPPPPPSPPPPTNPAKPSTVTKSKPRRDTAVLNNDWDIDVDLFAGAIAKGKRKGPMSDEARIHANEVRLNRDACIGCKEDKKQCNHDLGPNQPCKRCRDQQDKSRKGPPQCVPFHTLPVLEQGPVLGPTTIPLIVNNAYNTSVARLDTAINLEMLAGQLEERAAFDIHVKASDGQHLGVIDLAASGGFARSLLPECDGGILDLGTVATQVKLLPLFKSGWKACIRDAPEDVTGLIAAWSALDLATFECAFTQADASYQLATLSLYDDDDIAVATQITALLARALELSSFENLQNRLIQGLSSVADGEQTSALLDRVKQIVEALRARDLRDRTSASNHHPNLDLGSALSRAKSLGKILYFYHHSIRRRAEQKHRIREKRPRLSKQQREQKKQAAARMSSSTPPRVTLPPASACFRTTGQKLPPATLQTFETFWMA